MQPRFESFVTPRRRYVCLLPAIATVLASKAGDTRLPADVRTRCEDALDAMTGKDGFVAGLAGDFGEVCLEFLRLFDVRDHDPARTASQVNQFCADMHALFVKGYVICEPGQDQCLNASLGPRQTLAQIALENISDPLLLMCLILWELYSLSAT